MKTPPSLVRFGVSIPEDLLVRFDRLCRKKGWPNRSEAIRDLIRDAMVEEQYEEDREMVGSLTLVYNHHISEVGERLTEYQHRQKNSVISTLHVHLDRHNCLEVIVLRGRARALRNFADRLLGTRGVVHGKLVVTKT